MSAVIEIPDGRRHAPRLTLRTRGVLALAVLVLYVLAAAWFLATQRQALFVVAQQVDSHRVAQDLLAPSFTTLAHTLVQTQAILDSSEYSDGYKRTYAEIGASLDPLMSRLHRLRDFDPALAPYIEQLQSAVDAVRDAPTGQNLVQVRNTEQQMIAHMNDLLTSLEHRTEVLTDDYKRRQQLIGITAIVACIIGAAVSAVVILVFFTRLAHDIERLRARASAVVSGYAGAPLPNRRTDELGGLIDAINRMQVDLRRWEQQQEISRQQRFHQEKMAAVGSMAAVIGHEVSNPIAAIAGVAQYVIDETRGDDHKNSRLAHDYSVQILKQTERISLIMRQLATLTRRHSPEPELLDINALVQTTASFVAFDKRFRGIQLQYELDHGLPAVTCVADHMTQVLMNLLINAADAMEQVPKDGKARIRVATRTVGQSIRLDVTDTGHGMTPAVMARAFEESFSTKNEGKGQGIGLFLCKTLIEQAGGRIELDSTPGAGTTVSVYLPLERDGTASAEA
ncbi:MAG TPA: ATP-binding protein [Steroidobacteraceae bacterium]|nr:ATP-binding protein [Steroidobacteraceae bacterium]